MQLRFAFLLLALLSALFRALDADGDSLLSREELYVFAQATGFDDGLAEWGIQFADLCTQYGATFAGVGPEVLE